jgi:hypothetical protein
LLDSKQVVAVSEFNKEIFSVFIRRMSLQEIKENKQGWESKVPSSLATTYQISKIYLVTKVDIVDNNRT